VNGWPGAVEGMEQAAAHAGRHWSSRARQFLEDYIIKTRPEQLIAPEVREWAESNGLELPPNNYAWGNVFRMAAKDGLLRADGHRNYGNDRMHTRLVQIWAPL
jgi:hypothetical protein